MEANGNETSEKMSKLVEDIPMYINHSVQDLYFMTPTLIGMISDFVLYENFPQLEVLPYGKTARHYET